MLLSTYSLVTDDDDDDENVYVTRSRRPEWTKASEHIIQFRKEPIIILIGVQPLFKKQSSLHWNPLWLICSKKHFSFLDQLFKT